MTVAACLLLGVLLGALGAAYNRAILLALDRFAAFPTVPGPLRAAAVGGVVGLVAWFEPRLVGGGDPLIQAVLDTSLSLPTLAVILVARWLLGPLSYATRTPGGLFAPLLVIGAVVGSLFAQLAHEAVPGWRSPRPWARLWGWRRFSRPWCELPSPARSWCSA